MAPTGAGRTTEPERAVTCARAAVPRWASGSPARSIAPTRAIGDRIAAFVRCTSSTQTSSRIAPSATEHSCRRVDLRRPVVAAVPLRGYARRTARRGRDNAKTRPYESEGDRGLDRCPDDYAQHFTGGRRDLPTMGAADVPQTGRSDRRRSHRSDRSGP